MDFLENLIYFCCQLHAMVGSISLIWNNERDVKSRSEDWFGSTAWIFLCHSALSRSMFVFTLFETVSVPITFTDVFVAYVCTFPTWVSPSDVQELIPYPIYFSPITYPFYNVIFSTLIYWHVISWLPKEPHLSYLWWFISSKKIACVILGSPWRCYLLEHLSTHSHTDIMWLK